MLTKINYEVKGQLAKLLATEDLIIENRKVETAMFDVERRVLTLPTVSYTHLTLPTKA